PGQARWHGQGRGGHRHQRRAEDSGHLGGCGREDRRPASVRSTRIRRGAVRALGGQRRGHDSPGWRRARPGTRALVSRPLLRRLARPCGALALLGACAAPSAPPPETASGRRLPEGCKDEFAGRWTLASDPSWSYRASDDGGTVVLDVERRWADGG